MATAIKAPSTGMTGAVRSLQWTIQDLNGSVEHLGQSHDHLRRAQNIMAWTTAIFGALLLSGLVWIANDIFHLKDQLMETDRRFDGMEAQMSALGTRIDDLNITIEQIGAELLAARSPGAPAAPATGPDVSVLSTPTTSTNLQASTTAPASEAVAPDAAAQPQQQAALAQSSAAAPAPAAAAPQAVPAIAPSPPAPRDELTPAELAAPAPVLAAVAPADEPAPATAAPAAAAPDTEATDAAAATTAAVASPAPAAAAPAAASPAADLSDDELLSINDDQINPADELLLLDENGNPQ